MIYLDNAATTRVCEEAAAAAMRMMTEQFGNPSATYKLGREAKHSVDTARAQVASALGCRPDEVYFTSCGSEGDNWALLSGARSMQRKGKHIITSVMEHDAIRKTPDALEKDGFEVTRLSPAADGSISVEAVKAALRPDTFLIRLLMVNTESGTLTAIAGLSRFPTAGTSPARGACSARESTSSPA